MASMSPQGRNSLNIKLITSDVLLCHTGEHSSSQELAHVYHWGASFPTKPELNLTGYFSSHCCQIPEKRNLREKPFILLMVKGVSPLWQGRQDGLGGSVHRGGSSQ